MELRGSPSGTAHLREDVVPVVQVGAITPIKHPVDVSAILLLACEAVHCCCSGEKVLVGRLPVCVQDACLHSHATRVPKLKD